MYLFPSITSTKSSAVAFGSRMATSPLLILYSLRIALISSWSIFVSGTVFVIATPPLSFFRTVMFGGFLLRRMPNPSSSVSIIFLSPRGLRTSRTMKMRWHVRATGECRFLIHDSHFQIRSSYQQLLGNRINRGEIYIAGTCLVFLDLDLRQRLRWFRLDDWWDGFVRRQIERTKIQNLNRCSMDFESTRDSSKGGEIDLWHFWVCVS